MARTIDRLTARGIAAIARTGLYADGGGLYLRVDVNGSKRWVFIFRFAGKRCEMGLGSLVDISLAEARAESAKARKLVKAGTDPIAERRRLRASQSLQTFGDFAIKLVDDLAPGWRSPVHVRQWRTTLAVDAAALTPKALSRISTEDVLAVLQPIWQSKPETASRLRGRIERVLDAAKAKGLREGENPARWKGHLSTLLPGRRVLSRGHHPALHYDLIPAFMAALRSSDSLSARCLELTILTTCRTDASRQARGVEFEVDRGLWTVPAERTKRKVEHRIPLCARAIEIVKGCGDGFLFANGDKPLSNMAMLNLLPHLKQPDITVHGFRSTFRDWVGDCTTFSRELAESALHHVVGDAVEKAYRRSDAFHPRKPLMDAWGRYCAGESAAVVVPMPEASQYIAVGTRG